MRCPGLVRALVACLLVLGPGCGDEVVADARAEDGLELGGPALGISITEVEANQGAGVTIATGGSWVEPDARNAYLLRDRDTLLRVQHVLDDPEAWVPRELTGVLHIILPDGQEIVRTREFEVSADSDPRNLSTQFYFSLLAEEAQPGTRFWIELRESDPAAAPPDLPEGVNLSPAEGEPELVGFEDASLELEVVIVPVEYQHYDPPTLPDISEEDLQLFHDELLQQNPVQSVDIRIRSEPLVWSEQLTSLGELLNPTRALRNEDQPPPNVYYHALIDVKGSSVDMVAGIANFADASKEDAGSRVAATVYYKHVKPGDEETGEEPVEYPPSGSARTWVHEIGHNQGFRHVECPGGGAAGPDPEYPYADGKIGTFGFGIRNFHIYTPSASHDYMSYCGNSWVSDWTWNKAFERIEVLTSWSYQGPARPGATVAEPPPGGVLVGVLLPGGGEDWWVFDEPAPARRSGGQAVEFWRGAERIGLEYADVTLLSDGRTVMVEAPVPVELSQLDAITRLDERGQIHPVEVAGPPQGGGHFVGPLRGR